MVSSDKGQGNLSLPFKGSKNVWGVGVSGFKRVTSKNVPRTDEHFRMTLC